MKKPQAFPVYKFPDDHSKSLIFDLPDRDKMNIMHNNSASLRQNFNEVLIFYKGGGSHEIDFIKYPVHDHSIHFVAAGQVHILLSEENTVGCSILFSNEFLAFNNAKIDFLADLFFFQNGQANPVLNLAAEEFEIFHAIIELLKKEFFENRKFCRDILQSYLQAFFLNAKRFYDRSKTGANKKDPRLTVNNFLGLVEKHYIRHYTLNQYASLIHVTPKHLSSLCKKCLGKNAYTLVEEKLALEAKRLLFRTNKTIKEISFELNFVDPAYFARFFKKETGYSPHEFRENVQ